MYESKYFPSRGRPRPSGVSTVSFVSATALPSSQVVPAACLAPKAFHHTLFIFVQIDVPEGIPVDEVMKRFKNESRRVNTVMEVRP